MTDPTKPSPTGEILSAEQWAITLARISGKYVNAKKVLQRLYDSANGSAENWEANAQEWARTVAEVEKERDSLRTELDNYTDCFEQFGVANLSELIAAYDAKLEVAAERERGLLVWLKFKLDSDTVHVTESDQSGHPHGWCAVRIPDWDVKQKIQGLEEALSQVKATPKDPANSKIDTQ